MSTETSPKQINLFDSSLTLTMHNDVNGRVSIEFNHIQDGPIRSCSQMGKRKRASLPKICHTYSTIRIFDTVISSLKKAIHEISKSQDRILEFLWRQHFEINKFC